MDNKSTRHQESNTFKFQPFSERIANIDVDIFHQVGHEYKDQTEEDECFFFQAIQKWNVLNLTESYDEFRKDVKPHNIVTLPQLIHRKDEVVQVLLKHLKKKNVLCLQPLLEFVVALAKDLRKEFYPYYKDFLDVLIDLLNTKDTDQLEWTFSCLAYLYKFLWRSLIKDVGSVFQSLLPLLSDSKPEYVNNFAAESFAFVARKVKDRRAFLPLILKTVRNTQDGISRCGRLLFEVINSVNGQFHSSADSILPFYLESITDDKLPKTELFEILKQIIQNIVNTIHPQKSELLWKSLVALQDTLVQNWIEKQTESSLTNLELILKLTGEAVELLVDPSSLVKNIIKLLSTNGLPEQLVLTIVKIGILLLLSRNIKLSQDQASGLIRKILETNYDSVLLYFIKNISNLLLINKL